MTQKHINIIVDAALHEALESVARHDRKSVPQVVRLLIEEGLKNRTSGMTLDDTSTAEIASLAMAGGGLDWLHDEPDIYDKNSGQPV
jgi:hypothetical protein